MFLAKSSINDSNYTLLYNCKNIFSLRSIQTSAVINFDTRYKLHIRQKRRRFFLSASNFNRSFTFDYCYKSKWQFVSFWLQNTFRHIERITVDVTMNVLLKYCYNSFILLIRAIRSFETTDQLFTA